ncbi:hypothetical protein B0T25DRAFT_568954 [Lasiosphaeria hispida]|uniref:RING-type domain-containing protein n=1 Tax=Lasiosphaeria hispida TaxID=260671 RepID=A0AAJ0MER9_9PEZI|nr:hypothetical protein B0T25DRAFT_568954 [Lasiosphaeria hispida]
MAQPTEQNQALEREVIVYWPTLKSRIIAGGPLPPPIVKCIICAQELGMVGIAPVEPGSPQGPAGEREGVVLLPCGHVCGSRCARTWAQFSRNSNGDGYGRCPVCRFVMRFEGCGCHAEPEPLPPFGPSDNRADVTAEMHLLPETVPGGGSRFHGRCNVCVLRPLRLALIECETLRTFLLTGIRAHISGIEPLFNQEELDGLSEGRVDAIWNVIHLVMHSLESPFPSTPHQPMPNAN